MQIIKTFFSPKVFKKFNKNGYNLYKRIIYISLVLSQNIYEYKKFEIIQFDNSLFLLNRPMDNMASGIPYIGIFFCLALQGKNITLMWAHENEQVLYEKPPNTKNTYYVYYIIYYI